MKVKCFFILALFGAVGACRLVAYDANQDGMSDVFASHYGLSQDSADEDPDGDGLTNREESLWGTDPLTYTPVFTSLETYASNVFIFRYDSVVGHKYQIEFTDELSAATSWIELGNAQPGTDGEIAFGMQVLGDRGFWRLAHAGSIDADGDGLTLYEENLLGTSDNNVDTDGDYILDLNEFLAGTRPTIPDDPPAVTFSPAAGDYATAQSVELVNVALPNYIYYTTDGSEPSLFSAKYNSGHPSAPIETGDDVLLKIRAKVILPNGVESPESSGTYRVGTFASDPQTVYYGWVTASGSMGYAYSVSELTTVTNLYSPECYLTLGSGWIIDGTFEADRSAASVPLYYGLTQTYVSGIQHPIEGYTTDPGTFYTGANYRNYRAVGSGWTTGFDSFEPDTENTASQTIYLVSLTFSLHSSDPNYPRWLFTTENTDQFGRTYTSSPRGRIYPLGEGWVTSATDSMAADVSTSASEVYFGLAGSGTSILPNTHILTNFPNAFPLAQNRVRMGSGWGEGYTMEPDRSQASPNLYYGEKQFSDGTSARVYTTHPNDISTLSNRRLVAVGPGYPTSGLTYEISWLNNPPEDVYMGTEMINPAQMAHLSDFLAYDTSELASSPAAVLLGLGWIENNTFIAYAGTGDPDEDIDNDGLTLAEEIALGTNPNYWDTDGDLLPDGFEAASIHLDPLVPNPLRGEDFDGDGLDTYEELINGSDPDVYDTDGDGVNDGDEVAYGSDPDDITSKPFDPYDFVGPPIGDSGCGPLGDLGVLIPNGTNAGYSVSGTVGDPSESESERWRLKFRGRQIESQEFGVVDSFELSLHSGAVFEISLEHVATNLGETPDYDYEATITGHPGFLLSDLDGLLGTANDVDIGVVEAKRAYLAPITSVSWSESFTGGDAVGPRYRKVALNGRPLSDEKPEQEAETGQYAEETYIDAFDLSLHHDTSYLYTPLAASDLVLQVTASVRETGWSDRSGLKPHESLTQPFGTGWSSNLAAYVEAVETLGDVQTDPIAINVVDESGRSQRFGTTNMLTFFPWPSARVDKKTWLNTLEGFDTNADGSVDRLIYTKKYGTQLTYDLCDAWFMYSTDRVEGSNEVNKHRYWRLTEVVDRYGNDLQYDYGTSEVSLIPEVISSHSHPNQFIAIDRDDDCRRVESITDSRGNTISFNYNAVQVFDTTLTQLTSIDYPDGTTKRYAYETVLDVQNDDGRLTHHFHSNLKRIEDKSGNAHVFHYAFDRSKSYFTSGAGRLAFAVNINYLPPAVKDHLNAQLAAIPQQEGTAEYKLMFGLPRQVTQVDLPGAIGHSTFTKTAETHTEYGPEFSAASGTLVTDAVGSVTAYAFGGLAGEVVDIDDTGSTLSTEWMIYYTQMEVHHGGPEGQPGHLGKETFTFDLASGLALSSVTDFSGNTTTWEFEDAMPPGRPLPQLAAAANFMTRWADPTRKTDALNRVESYQYDGDTRILSQIKDVYGTVTTYSIDAMGRRQDKTVTDATGTKLREEVYTYADEDTDPLTTYRGFMVEKRVVAYQNLSGEAWEQDLVTKYVHDAQGRLWKEIVDPLESGEGLALTTEFAYDLNNNRTSVTDPRNNETVYTYDKLNRLVQITYPVAGVDFDAASGEPVESTTTKRLLYNERGNFVCEVDENGHFTFHFYDALGRKTKTVRDMDGVGLPTLPPINDPQIIELDPATHITAADIVTEKAYNAVNSLDSTTDPRGTVTKNFYDDLQRVTHTYTHFETGDANADGTENGTAVADSSEKIHTEFVYEIAQNTGASGFSTEGFKPTQIIFHDAVRGAEGTSGLWTLNSHFTYDADYRETQSRIEYTPGQFNQTDTAYGTITDGKEALVSTVTDARGKVTRTSLDGLKRSTLVQHALGTTEQIQTQTFYTSTGLAWKTIDPNGNETQTEYDLAARPVKVWQSDPASGLVHPSNSPVTETIYDAASNIAATINPLGNRWDYTHDARNRRIKEEAPAVVNAESGLLTPVRPVTETYFDGVGNVNATKDPRGAVTETDFDRANRPTAVTTPAVPVFAIIGDIQLSSVTHYDKNSNVVKVTDYEGNTTVNFYDKLNRLKATGTNPATGQPSEIEGSPNSDDILVSSAYDDASNLVQVVDGEGAVTGFRYDGLSRSTQTIWDEGADLERIKTLTYDALLLTQRTDEKSQVTQYSYDGLHRLEDVVHIGRTVDNRHYTYDDNSNILTVTHPNEAKTLRDTASTYDALNRLTGETSADVTHTYVHDKVGNRETTTYGQTGRQIVSTYDALNRLETMTEGSRVTTYAYNLNGSIVEKVLPNDVTVESSFDLLGRKQSSTNTADGAAQPFAQYLYAHDKQGNLREIDESYPLGNLTDRIVFNTYDKTYRLAEESISTATGATVTAYLYDNAHNRTQKTVTLSGGTPEITAYAYGDGSTASTANSNQLVSFTKPDTSVVAFTYDLNGNRATRTESGETDTYSYDYENRLLGLDYQTGSTDTGLYEYGYDYRTRRVDRDESAVTGRDRSLIVFSGGTSAQEHTTAINSNPAVENIRGSDYGGGIGGILYTLRSGIPSIKHYNSRGDIVAATDASGSLTYQAAYEAFGKHGDTPSSQEWGSTADRQQANTKDEDPTGLLNEGFRYRDLETGTFITRDPLGFVDGPNVYTYVVQNPWTKFDPLGLQGARTYSAAVSAQKAYGRAQYGNMYKAANRATQIKLGLVSGVTLKAKAGPVTGQVTLASADITSTHQMDGASETTVNGTVGAELSYKGSLGDAKVGISKTATAGITSDKNGNLDTIEEQHSIIGVDINAKSGGGIEFGNIDGEWAANVNVGAKSQSDSGVEGSAKAQVDSNGSLSSTVSLEVGVGLKVGVGWSGEAYDSHLSDLNNQVANEIEEKYGVRPKTESETPKARPKPQRRQRTEDDND